jgi:hypothetical protein
MLGFKLGLEKYLDADLHTLTFIRLNAPTGKGIAKAQLTGDLRMKQRSTITVTDRIQNLYDISIGELMTKYSMDELEEMNYD